MNFEDWPLPQFWSESAKNYQELIISSRYISESIGSLIQQLFVFWVYSNVGISYVGQTLLWKERTTRQQWLLLGNQELWPNNVMTRYSIRVFLYLLWCICKGFCICECIVNVLFCKKNEEKLEEERMRSRIGYRSKHSKSVRCIRLYSLKFKHTTDIEPKF